MTADGLGPNVAVSPTPTGVRQTQAPPARLPPPTERCGPAGPVALLPAASSQGREMRWGRGLEDWHEHGQQICGDGPGRPQAGSAAEVDRLSFEIPACLTVAKVHLEGGAGNGVPLAVQASRDSLLPRPRTG